MPRALFAASLLLAGAGAARADDDVPRLDAVAQAASGVHVQFGGTFQPPRPAHEVSVTSDADGTRVLALDTTGLLVDSTGNGARQQVCVAPCRAGMSPSTTYMIRGWGISDSAHFGVRDETRALHVHSGSAAVGVLGGVSLGIGIPGILVGAVTTPIGYALGKGDSAKPVATDVGWATLIGGAALITLGVVLELASNTHVYDENGARLARGPRLTPAGLLF